MGTVFVFLGTICTFWLGVHARVFCTYDGRLFLLLRDVSPNDVWEVGEVWVVTQETFCNGLYIYTRTKSPLPANCFLVLIIRSAKKRCFSTLVETSHELNAVKQFMWSEEVLYIGQPG